MNVTVTIIADAVHVLVHPDFDMDTASAPATGVNFDLIRWAVDNVHVAAVGLPARPAGCCLKMLVGIRDTAIMFLFELVLNRARRRIAPLPELLDELFPFVIGRQFLERGALFIGDDVDHVLIQPLM